MARVAIAQGSDVYDRTRLCLETLGRPDGDQMPDAFLKFNTAPFQLFGTTQASGHPETVRAVAHYLRAGRTGRLQAGDGPGAPDPGKGFRECGYTQMCAEEGIELVDLDADEVEQIDIPGALSLHRIGIVASVRACQGLVSIAWMRTHGYTTISLCMKNLMGVIGPSSDRGTMHVPFPERITDLVSALRPGLSVIDGTTRLDEGVSRTPVPLDVTVAGWDIVAVDAVGTAIMGFDPMQIEHIWLAHQRGLGTADLSEIEIVGRSLGDVQQKYAPIGAGMRTSR
ncbi:MAG: DUF362 domain-containing protein [Candidatus Latescibacterota bacterium]